MSLVERLRALRDDMRHNADEVATLDLAIQALDAIGAARAQHPTCDRHEDDSPISCGWKACVLDIDAALESGGFGSEGDDRG